MHDLSVVASCLKEQQLGTVLAVTRLSSAPGQLAAVVGLEDGLHVDERHEHVARLHILQQQVPVASVLQTSYGYAWLTGSWGKCASHAVSHDCHMAGEALIRWKELGFKGMRLLAEGMHLSFALTSSQIGVTSSRTGVFCGLELLCRFEPPM